MVAVTDETGLLAAGDCGADAPPDCASATAIPEAPRLFHPPIAVAGDPTFASFVVTGAATGVLGRLSL
jgi:hypothetical protein